MWRLCIVVCFSLFACTADKPPADNLVTDSYDPSRDYFSYANTDAFLSKHLSLNLEVDFDKRQLRGEATLTLKTLNPDARQIDLDTRDLSIAAVRLSNSGAEALPAPFELQARDNILGSKLSVTLPPSFKPADEFKLHIQYTTAPESTALQWLPAELTSGGQQPLLFSQSQAIHARSWIPLQDTPAVRITYDAQIKTPPQLLALMSASNDPEAERDGDYFFEMPQPIPSYLIAIAVGNIYFAPIGEQTGVYAEPELLEASAWEFADTQAMLEQAERQFGPYEWGRYDLLILPPSFPYGGMENPRLSFLTPSLLAGDRSLVSVVAHELAHSWSGNLVTNATWRDGWLNEGMTSYLEARLMEVIYSEQRVAEEDVLNYRELLLDFESVPAAMQALAPRLDSGDPDSFQGTIHYHKGKFFLQNLEHAFGRAAFDHFLTEYFTAHAFDTITTEQFLDYLDRHLLSGEDSPLNREHVEQWLYKPGLPEGVQLPHSDSLDAAAAMAVAWSEGTLDTLDITIDDWSPQAVVHFINSLADDLPDDRLAELDAALTLSDTRNAEIGRTWFIQAAKRRYKPAYQKLQIHVNRYGRTRLIKPVYEALAKNGQDLEFARRVFNDARDSYHPITVASIAKVLQ